MTRLFETGQTWQPETEPGTPDGVTDIVRERILLNQTKKTGAYQSPLD